MDNMKNPKHTDRIVIQLDNNKYYPLIEISDRLADSKNTVEITTVRDYQTSGYLSVYVEKTRGARLVKLGEIRIENIPPTKAGEPVITVSAKIQKHRYLSIEITVENEKNIQQTFDLHRHLKKSIAIEKLYPYLFISLVGLLVAIALLPNTEEPEGSLPLKKISAGKTSTEGTSATKTRHREIASTSSLLSPPSLTSRHKKLNNNQTYKSQQTNTIKITKKIFYFLPDSYHLTEKAREGLKKLIPTLNSVNDLKNSGIRRIKIYGHCALYGTERGRYKLSYQRALAVYKYLLKEGWRPKVKPEIKGWGGTNPVTRDPKKQNLNRRVEILFAIMDE